MAIDDHDAFRAFAALGRADVGPPTCTKRLAKAVEIVHTASAAVGCGPRETSSGATDVFAVAPSGFVVVAGHPHGTLC